MRAFPLLVAMLAAAPAAAETIYVSPAGVGAQPVGAAPAPVTPR